MNAIAGIVYFDRKPVDPGILERMKNIPGLYGRDAQHLWHEPGAGMVRTLCPITPEEALDRPPLKGADGNLVLVFDGRVHNREEPAEKLNPPPCQARLMADSAFFLKAFEQWKEACLDFILGDFAFATLSKGMFAIPEVPQQLYEERMADYLALLPVKGPESFYKDICRVEPGHFLVLEDGRVHTRRYHRFDPEHPLVFKNHDDYVDAARELMHQAVKCRLRTMGNIAGHLSSGLDRSTVTATAAELLQQEGKRLLAFTAMPREGFAGPVPKGRNFSSMRMRPTHPSSA